jgi:PhnB protein
MKLEAYLFFPGNAEEAMIFYREVFGGDLAITRLGDIDPAAPESEKHRVINATLDDGSFVLRASDRVDATLDPQTRIELTVVGSDESKLRQIFEALSDGGTVKARLEKMFWGDIFGGLVDKYGIGWQVNINANP